MRTYALVMIIFILIASSYSYSASFDIAKELKSNKLYDDAKKEIIKIIYSDKITPSMKAEGYYLLGNIDLEKNNFDGVQKNWGKVIQDYPDSPFVPLLQDKLKILNLILNPPEEKQEKGFDFHGLKSGMSKNDLINFLSLDGVAYSQKAKYSSLYRDTSISEMIEKMFSEGISWVELNETQFKDVAGKGSGIYKMYFDFTDKGKLWRVILSYFNPKDPLKSIALKQSLEKKFKNRTIDKSSDYYSVVLTDYELAHDCIERYFDDYNSRL